MDLKQIANLQSLDLVLVFSVACQEEIQKLSHQLLVKEDLEMPHQQLHNQQEELHAGLQVEEVLTNLEIDQILQGKATTIQDFMELPRKTQMKYHLKIEMMVSNLENWLSTKRVLKNHKKKIMTRLKKKSLKMIISYKCKILLPTTTSDQLQLAQLTQSSNKSVSSKFSPINH